MNAIYSTPLLRRLCWKRLLHSRLPWIGISEEHLEKWLIDLNRHGHLPLNEYSPVDRLNKLKEFGLVELGETLGQDPDHANLSRHMPFQFVRALNLELTY